MSIPYEMDRRYVMSSDDFIVSSEAPAFPSATQSLLVREYREHLGERQLEEYIESTALIFLERFEHFRKLKRKLDEREKKELSFLLGLLVDAHTVLWDIRSHEDHEDKEDIKRRS